MVECVVADHLKDVTVGYLRLRCRQAAAMSTDRIRGYPHTGATTTPRAARQAPSASTFASPHGASRLNFGRVGLGGVHAWRAEVLYNTCGFVDVDWEVSYR